MTTCYHCGRADASSGPMHTEMLSPQFPERRRVFCCWNCANEHMRINEYGLEQHQIQIRFLGKYGDSHIKILGRE